MAQVSQARWLDRLELDFDDLSGRYFGIGALLATLRILLIIGRTSGLLGAPPDAQLLSETVLEVALPVYVVLGFVVLVAVLLSRYRSEENVTSTRLIINFAGVVLLMLFAARVAHVVDKSPESFPITIWGGQLTNGLVLGGVYALVALGYTLVYGILFMINFAHGEVLIAGTYGGWFAMTYVTEVGGGSFETGAGTVSLFLLPLVIAILFLPLEALITRLGQRSSATAAEPSPTWFMTVVSLPFRFIVGALVGYGLLQAMGGFAPHVYLVVVTVVALIFIVATGMITSMLVAVGLERVAYRPLRHAPRLTPLISAIGASFFLQQAMQNIFGPGDRQYRRPELIADTIKLQVGDLGTIPIPKTGVIIIVVSILLMIFLYTFVQRSKTGRAMRAVAEDKNTAALMGVNVDQVIVVTFALGALLAGAAGVMMGFHNYSFKSRSGFIPGLKAFTAAVLGGIGNIPGAMFGGLFLGLVESLGPTMLGIPNEYQDVIAFSLLVLVLIFRPTGIFGEVLSEKKV